MPDRSPWRRHWRQLSGPVRAAYYAGTFLTVLLVVATLGAYGVYRHLTGNITSVHVSGLTHRSVYGVQDILLLGSQTRKGQGRGFGSNTRSSWRRAWQSPAKRDRK